jgi:hypothetical protein
MFVFSFKDALQAQLVIKKMSEMMDTSSKLDTTKDNVDSKDQISELEKVPEVS